MSKKILKSITIIATLSLMAFIVIIVFNSSKSQAAGNTIKVSASDLTNAGFTGVKKIKPQANGRYVGPNLYFSVNNKLSPADSKIPKAVMIDDLLLPYNPPTGALFIYGSDSHSFNIHDGAGKEATIADGRTAINFVKGYHYIVVIGPNKTDTENLASNLANKIQ